MENSEKSKTKPKNMVACPNSREHMTRMQFTESFIELQHYVFMSTKGSSERK